jgi:hypothetical protein
MSDGVIIALMATVVSPSLLAWFTNRQRRAEKQQDWDRQDEVARQQKEDEERKTEAAEEAARLNEERQDRIEKQAQEAARLLVESNKAISDTAGVIIGKVDDVHDLVNSDLTKAKESDLSAERGKLVMMKEIVRLNQEAGRDPSAETLGEIEFSQHKINETDIAHRKEQTELVEDHQAAREAASKQM